MPTGIIISTQTPEPGESFPRAGGTAWGIQQATGLNVIHMHQDGQAREKEKEYLKKVRHEGLVIITGHGNSGGDEISGAYMSTSSPTEESITLSHSIETYVNLIIQNSSLVNGDNLTIVLWICKGAAGYIDSTAAKMANLFASHPLKKINVSILASTESMQRFGASDQSLFNVLKIGARDYRDLRYLTYVHGQLTSYCLTDKAILSKKGLELPQLKEDLIWHLIHRRDYRNITREGLELNPKLLDDYGYIFRPSSENRKNNGYYYFTLTLKQNNKINPLFRINHDNKIEEKSHNRWKAATNESIDDLLYKYRMTKSDNPHHILIKQLRAYLSNRQSCQDKYGTTKEYFYPFFTCLQKSYQQKLAAVNDMVTILSGGTVAQDLATHTSVLRNGKLGTTIRKFLQDNSLNDGTGRITTVCRFIDYCNALHKLTQASKTSSIN